MNRITGFDNALLPGRYSNLDRAWEQFISDHIQNLKAESTFVEITPDLAGLCQYNPERLFSHLNNSGRGIKWIVFALNQIKSDKDFVKVYGLYIPSEQVIENYYSRYITTRVVSTG